MNYYADWEVDWEELLYKNKGVKNFMSKILIIEDDNLIEKFLNEISTEISVADITKIHKIDKTENSGIFDSKGIWNIKIIYGKSS